MANDNATRSTIIPCLRYRDAAAAVDWLCRNFGFTRQLVVPGEGGQIVHAQLTFGSGMMMLGSAGQEGKEYGEAVRQPDQVGGYETQSPYVMVADADEVYRTVKADGGTIVIELKDEDYGGRGFTCRDLEGHLWSVGTYDPWATH